ncbi:hypothetical protein AcW2_004698 [Taiwanofungus camphoratus]|nr:hypothetical protein AcW2_004698 [Antrodia cinnamomea]
MVGTLSGSSSGPAQNGVAQRIFDEQDLGTNASALESQKHDFGSEDSKGPRKATPLPKVQLLTLCAVRLVDPIAFTQIFPYVNEMMERLHLTKDPSKIGFYSGMVESSFAVSQLCCIYNWAKVSDNIGRRPVVLAGILGIGVSTMLLGLSHSLAGVLLARCVAGIFSGNIAVIHSVLGELTDSTNQAIAFPIYGLFWPLGAIIGPLLGGTLSDPATKYPKYFNYDFLKAYPYFLPCFVAGVISLMGATLVYCFLEETLPSKRNKDNYLPMRQIGSEHRCADPEKPPQTASMKMLFSIPIIRALCISGFALAFLNTGFDVTFVLFSYSPIQRGGLSFSASQIGYALATSGAISAALQLFCMPYLLRRFDHARMYNFCMGIWPLAYALLPGLNLIARGGLDAEGQITPTARAFVWIGIALLLGLARTACLAYSWVSWCLPVLVISIDFHYIDVGSI